MTHDIDFGHHGIRCRCYSSAPGHDRTVAYLLYPAPGVPDDWIGRASRRYGVAIAVVTVGMDAWQDLFSPWPAPGVPPGSPDFKGESPEFLQMLRREIIPAAEHALGLTATPERTLVGVSMSGLFALWQWLECDTFTSIASLSGSFWYEGFAEWMASRAISPKEGSAFFLLGNQEAESPVRAFRTVGVNTRAIIARLERAGIRATFRPVPGNHFSDPLPRLDAAFAALFPLVRE